VLHAGPTDGQQLTGASAQLDFTARARLDVRFHAGVANGSGQGFEDCGDPTVSCAPREVQVEYRRTTVGLALPVRLTRRGALDLQLVPGLEGNRFAESTQFGLSLGLETRYRPSPASRLQIVAAADISRTGEFLGAADAPSYDGTLTRFSVGARYQFYTRR
jgi:hypothetical protein